MKICAMGGTDESVLRESDGRRMRVEVILRRGLCIGTVLLACSSVRADPPSTRPFRDGPPGGNMRGPMGATIDKSHRPRRSTAPSNFFRQFAEPYGPV